MEYLLNIACRVYITSDAHFWKTHNIDALAHAFFKIGMDGCQIIIDSTFFTMHLDEANPNCFHSKPVYISVYWFTSLYIFFGCNNNCGLHEAQCHCASCSPQLLLQPTS